MLRSVTPGVALEPLRARFQMVARQVTGGLGAISARIYELPEAQRPPLLTLLLELEGVQLKLRQYVEQIEPGEGAELNLESAIREQLGLLARLSALAERVGLIKPRARPQPAPLVAGAASAGPSTYRQDFAAALAVQGRTAEDRPAFPCPSGPSGYWDGDEARGPWVYPPAPVSGAYLPQMVPPSALPAPPYYAVAPHPGALPPGYPAYYVPVAPAWPQFLQRYERSAARDAEHDDCDAEDSRRGSRRAREDESRGASWSPLRNFSSIALMLVAAGGVAVADRMYRHNGREDKLAVAQEPAPEPEHGSAGELVVGKKLRGRLERPSDRSEGPDLPRDLAAESRAPVQAEQRWVAAPTGDRPAPTALDGMETDGIIPQRPIEKRTAGVLALPSPAKVLVKASPPSAISNPHPNAATVPGKTKLAAVPPAVAAKPRVPGVAPPPPAEPDEAPPSGGLFVPVLSTHKDAKAAREAFADLQKQHVAVLGAKQSEVQTSGETGAWHRLVVTPASTKEAATEICNKLRAAGYARCWVKPY